MPGTFSSPFLSLSLYPFPYPSLIPSFSATVTLDNVLFGDVILCGGQSNMQFSVNAVFNASEELQAANKYPNIRVSSFCPLYSSLHIISLSTLFIQFLPPPLLSLYSLKYFVTVIVIHCGSEHSLCHGI